MIDEIRNRSDMPECEDGIYLDDADRAEFDFEDIPYDSFVPGSVRYDGMENTWVKGEVGGAFEPTCADTVRGMDPAELFDRHRGIIKYDEARFDYLYEELKRGIYERGEIDEDVFNDIFFGKITPIVKNCYNSFRCSFVCENVSDIFNEAYMLIYKKSIHHFFCRPDDDGSLPKDKVSYLKWCKTCIMNSIKSKLRGKKKIDLVSLRHEAPERDGETTDPMSLLPDTAPTPEQVMIERSMIEDMFRYVACLNSKPEKKLVWYALQLLILDGTASDKIAANHIVYDECSNKTLAEFALWVLEMLDQIEWININAENRISLCDGVFDGTGISEKGRTALSDLISGKSDDSSREGVFLKKISDWVFKINSSLSMKYQR